MKSVSRKKKYRKSRKSMKKLKKSVSRKKKYRKSRKSMKKLKKSVSRKKKYRKSRKSMKKLKKSVSRKKKYRKSRKSMKKLKKSVSRKKKYRFGEDYVDCGHFSYIPAKGPLTSFIWYNTDIRNINIIGEVQMEVNIIKKGKKSKKKLPSLFYSFKIKNGTRKDGFGISYCVKLTEYKMKMLNNQLKKREKENSDIKDIIINFPNH